MREISSSRPFFLQRGGFRIQENQRGFGVRLLGTVEVPVDVFVLVRYYFDSIFQGYTKCFGFCASSLMCVFSMVQKWFSYACHVLRQPSAGAEPSKTQGEDRRRSEPWRLAEVAVPRGLENDSRKKPRKTGKPLF